MDDLIRRQAVSKYVSKMITNRTYPEERQILEDFIEWLDNLPSAEETAEWILKDGIYGVAYCSKCDYELHTDDTNYCPNCGRRMKEEREDQEDGR